MLKIALSIPLLLATAAAPVLATEVGKIYYEVGYAQISYSESGVPTFSIPAVKATFGAVVSNGLAVEGFLATGVSSPTETFSGMSVKLSLDSSYGFYARPFVKIGESAEIYGRLGFAKSSVTASTSSASVSDGGSDFSYGIGAAFDVAKNTQVVVDYMNYYSKQGTDIKGFGVGVKIGF